MTSCKFKVHNVMVISLSSRRHSVDSWVSSMLDESFMRAVATSVWSVLTQHLQVLGNICKWMVGRCLGWILRLFECRAGALLCGMQARFHHLPTSFLANLLSASSEPLPLDKWILNSPCLYTCAKTVPNSWDTFGLMELVGNPYLTLRHIHAVKIFSKLEHLV